MTPLYLRPRPVRLPQGVVPVERPPRGLTLAKLAGLVTITTIGVALTLTVVMIGALFAILNIA